MIDVFIGFFLACIIHVCVAVLRTLLCVFLWNIFGLPHVTLWQGIGIALILIAATLRVEIGSNDLDEGVTTFQDFVKRYKPRQPGE